MRKRMSCGRISTLLSPQQAILWPTEKYPADRVNGQGGACKPPEGASNPVSSTKNRPRSGLGFLHGLGRYRPSRSARRIRCGSEADRRRVNGRELIGFSEAL